MTYRSPGTGNGLVNTSMDVADRGRVIHTELAVPERYTAYPGHNHHRAVVGVQMYRFRSDAGAAERNQCFPLALSLVARRGSEELRDKRRILDRRKHCVGHTARHVLEPMCRQICPISVDRRAGSG